MHVTRRKNLLSQGTTPRVCSCGVESHFLPTVSPVLAGRVVYQGQGRHLIVPGWGGPDRQGVGWVVPDRQYGLVQIGRIVTDWLGLT